MMSTSAWLILVDKMVVMQKSGVGRDSPFYLLEDLYDIHINIIFYYQDLISTNINTNWIILPFLQLT